MSRLMQFIKKHKAISIVVICVVLAGVTAAFALPRLLNRMQVVAEPPAAEAPAAEEQAAEGQKIVVTVSAASVEDMYGYQFEINYNSEELEYTGELKSKVDEIQTIFSKPHDGYELVGALMIGDKKGYSGENIPICEIVFSAKKAAKLSDYNISLAKVNIVDSKLVYTEGHTDWSFQAAVQS